MTSLIISIGEGKGTWASVAALTKAAQWDCIYIITTSFFMDKFTVTSNSQQIILDDQKPIAEIVKTLREKLEKIEGDVAVNLISGNGKIHMAIIATLMKLPVGIRLVNAGTKGVEEV
jgi:FixJ family two-component response regulator